MSLSALQALRAIIAGARLLQQDGGERSLRDRAVGKVHVIREALVVHGDRSNEFLVLEIDARQVVRGISCLRPFEVFSFANSGYENVEFSKLRL